MEIEDQRDNFVPYTVSDPQESYKIKDAYIASVGQNFYG